MPENRNNLREFFTISHAAETIGIKSIEYCRKLLGTPDCIQKCRTGKRFLYSTEKVKTAKENIAIKRNRKSMDRGKRSCYQCRNKFIQTELSSGICPGCRAKKIVLNFACHGDCLLHCPDPERICILRKAIDDYEQKIKKTESQI